MVKKWIHWIYLNFWPKVLCMPALNPWGFFLTIAAIWPPDVDEGPLPSSESSSTPSELLTSFFQEESQQLNFSYFLPDNWVVSFMLSNQLYFECFRNCPARWMDVSLHLIIIDSSHRSAKETFASDPIKAGVGQTPLNHHLSLIIYSLVLLIMYCNMCYRYQSLSNISQLL